ncbi:hypothetical protein D9M71_251050 [compost metagenome]
MPVADLPRAAAGLSLPSPCFLAAGFVLVDFFARDFFFGAAACCSARRYSVVLGK